MTFIERVFCVVAICAFCTGLSAQDYVTTGGKPARRYTFVVNNAPDSLDAPSIGIVNIAEGSHRSFQLGIFNRNALSLTGLQYGMANVIGGSHYGAQAGFYNLVRGPADGSQSGLLNFSRSDRRGLMLGLLNIGNGYLNGVQQSFVNYVGKELYGAQVGFFNTVITSGHGAQIGLINNVIEEFYGVQTGFLNTSFTSTEGLQLGFINFSGRLKGCQIGLINYSESVERGVPVGLLSFVHNGGYRAIEISITEAAPLQFSVKLGVSKLYTSLIAAMTPDSKFGYGAGLGSIIPLKGALFLNPELNQVFDGKKNGQSTLSLVPLLGWRKGRFSFVGGFSASYMHSGQLHLDKPLFSLASHKFDARNSLSLGAKAGIRMTW